MMYLRRGVFHFIISVLFASAVPALAKSNRLIVESDTTVFTGPGFKFRPLTNAKSGDQFPLSKKVVVGRDGGEFYKVLIKKKSGPPRVGFIPIEASVRTEFSETDSPVDDDVDSYIPFSQADTSFQVGFAGLKDSNFLWTVGYAKYPAPGLYLKLLVGQLLYKRAGSLLGGVEVGFEQSTFDQFSLYLLLSSGVVNIPIVDEVFAGSKSLSFFTQSGMGIRYTADEDAAVSFGLLQIAIFSPNGSYISPGAGISLEVGL